MKVFFVCCIMLASIQLFAQNNNILPAEKGTIYGAGVSNDIVYDIYSPEKAIQKLATVDSLNDIVIQATVTGVCPKKGCWMTLENKSNETFFVKMKDYGFFVPQSILGRQVFIHGNIKKKTTSVKELKHYAEDAKKTPEEIAAITAPKTEYRVLASGIKVL